MMKKILSNRLAAPTLIVTGLLLVTFLSRNVIQKGFDIKRLLAGVQTCTSRTNQTFTATMIGETGSGFTSGDFVNLTDECLAELNSLAQKTTHIANDVKDDLSELSEKTHWFHQKVIKILAQVKEGGEGLNTFDIASRYEVLDLLRGNALASIETVEAENIDATNTYLALGMFLAILAFLTVGYSFLKKVSEKYSVAHLEETANEIITNSNMMVATADKLFFDYFKLVDLPGLKGLFSRYSEEILTMGAGSAKGLKASSKVLKVQQEIKQQRAHFDLSESLEAGVESLQKQAFKHKVRVDANWNDKLNIMGNQENVAEGLKFLFTDLLGKSHEHQIDRRLTLRTRVLGGTSYLKIAIKDYCFNTSYLDFENSLMNKSTDLTKNIAKAYKAFSQENIKVVFKNGLNEDGKIANAVVEVVFETMREEDIALEATTGVVRGSKASILSSLR